jgi:hypothetical protein
MPLNIPSKFGSSLPEKPSDKKGIDFNKLSEQIRFEREYIQPHLTNQQCVLYHHRCELFVGNYYHGKHHFLDHSNSESEDYPVNRNCEYDEVGNILAQIWFISPDSTVRTFCMFTR